MDVAPLATLAGLLLLKEMGVPIPVPGDLLVLGAGAATSGRPEAAVWLAAILAAGYAGGTIQFLLIRGAMRGPLLALLARIGVPEARLDGLAATFRSGGPRAVAVARTTPGLRVAAIAASGVAALPMRTFLPGLVAGNTVFVAGHFGLGFVVGKPALGVASELGSPAVIAAILVGLSAVGAVAWVAIRRRSAAPGFVAAPALAAGVATQRRGHGPGEGGVAAWADAACPICFTLAAVRATRAVRPSHRAALLNRG
jgi:membrane protein DedA with SNARE-associated domain